MIVFELIGLLLLAVGIGAIAMALVVCYKLPDAITKVHGASIIDSLALPMCFLGLAMLQNNMQSVMKLLFVMVLIYLIAPVSAHAIGQIYLLNQQNGDNK